MSIQNGEFVCGLVCGNLGPSYRQRGVIVQDILFKPPDRNRSGTAALAIPMRLGLFALLIAMLIGIPVGILSALKQNYLDRLRQPVHRHGRHFGAQISSWRFS